MAGELADTNVSAAARAAGFNAEVLKRTEDGFSPLPQSATTFEDFKARLDKAGHKIGGGFDGCPECMRVASELPALIQMAMSAGEAG